MALEMNAEEQALENVERLRALVGNQEDGRPPSPQVELLVALDVLAIVRGKRYPPRGFTEEFRIPEDISTKEALRLYGINAYEK